MKRLFPRLKSVFDPNRKNDTKYGGTVVIS